MGMSEEQARSIVKAINQRALVSEGIGDDQPLLSLDGVTLAQMLEATETVKAANDRAMAAAAENGGRFSISMVPADRLIAAVFVTEHNRPSRDSILMLPPNRAFGRPRALLLWPVEPGDIAPDDEDGEEEIIIIKADTDPPGSSSGSELM